MSFLKSNHSKNPTKMFISHISEPPQTKGLTKSPTGSIVSKMLGAEGIVIDMILNAAPKVIEEGLELISKTITKFAEKDVTKTTVKRNIDIFSSTKMSIPSNITLIRGEFSPNVTDKGETFGDGHDKNTNQATLIGHKELHIEIDIIQSKDNSSIYFQPKSYFYNGVDREGDTIDEIVLAFAFVPVDQSILNVEALTFQNFVHFDNLKPHTQYLFKTDNGYDCSYQSTWIEAPFTQSIPYTLVVEIQEIREGNSFAKLLQTVYIENKAYIQEGLQHKVNTLKVNYSSPATAV